MAFMLTRPIKERSGTTIFILNARVLFSIAACHFLLIALLQAEDYWLTLFPTSITVAQYIQLIGEDLFVALVFGAFATLIYANRFFFMFWVVLVNTYLIVDFAYYRIFFQHFDSSSLEGTANLFALTSSVLHELDKVFYFNAVMVIIITLSLGLLLRHATHSTDHRRMFLTTLSIFSLVGLIAVFLPFTQSGYHHPFTHAIKILFNSARTDFSSTQLLVANAKALSKNDYDLELANLSTKTTALSKPNVILIVLESVGSRQFLDKHGMPSATYTPTLHQLAKNAVIFNSIYSLFPGTTRSHVALNTGGHAITLSGISEELTHHYKGPTLARAFKQQGYRTALFASVTLGFENLDKFYHNMGFDALYDFGTEKTRFKPDNWLHSWGAKEERVVPLAIDWLKKENFQQPFFMVYLNNATHHPYSIPEGYDAPVKKDDRRSRSLNALHYTDHSLKPLLTFLQDNHLMDNTIIAIVGDHGEAFGDRHVKNLLHANYLYEENIKNFFMISNPQLTSKPLTSQRLGSLGDVLPTLLATANLPAVEVPGENILQPQLEQRIQYFYKILFPPQWGLRDGKWKFINEQTGQNPELYDLEQDPNEQQNLATQYPDMIRRYRTLAANWYAQTDAAYLAQLENYRAIGNRYFTSEDLLSAGPKVLAFGYQQLKEGELVFTESSSFHPNENVALWTKWVAYPKKKTIHLRWTSPRQRNYEADIVLEAGAMATTVSDVLPPPMEQGKWRVELFDQGQQLASAQFIVDAKQPLHQPLPAHPVAKEVAVGSFIEHDKKQRFDSTQALKGHEQAVVSAKWWPPLGKQKFTYIWRSPTGKEQRFTYETTQGWRETWVTYDGPLPMQAGKWSVSIHQAKETVASVTFAVLP